MHITVLLNTRCCVSGYAISVLIRFPVIPCNQREREREQLISPPHLSKSQWSGEKSATHTNIGNSYKKSNELTIQDGSYRKVALCFSIE